MKPPQRRQSFDSAKDAAEAAFKSATTWPVETPSSRPATPGVREQVTLRIDQDVLEHFRADGPGWQERLNEALRRAIAKDAGG